MARLAAGLDRADAAQQRRPVTALPAAVVRKYAEDRAGLLAGQIAYAGFLALFPMLLVLLTLVEVVLSGHPQLQNDVVDAALRQFPVLGPELRRNVHGLSSGNVVALVALLVWSLWGSLRLSRNAQVMMAEVWGDDRGDRTGFWRRLPRDLGFLAVIGAGFLAGGALAGVASAGRLGSVSAWVALVPLVAVNVVMYWGPSPCWPARLIRPAPTGGAPRWPGWAGRCSRWPGPSSWPTRSGTSPPSTAPSGRCWCSSGGSPSGRCSPSWPPRPTWWWSAICGPARCGGMRVGRRPECRPPVSRAGNQSAWTATGACPAAPSWAGGRAGMIRASRPARSATTEAIRKACV